MRLAVLLVFGYQEVTLWPVQTVSNNRGLDLTQGPLPVQYNSIQRSAEIHPHHELDLNPRVQSHGSTRLHYYQSFIHADLSGPAV